MHTQFIKRFEINIEHNSIIAVGEIRPCFQSMQNLIFPGKNLPLLLIYTYTHFFLFKSS